MLATEYHRKFTDLFLYCPEIAENPNEMLRHFKKGTRKWLHSMATSTPYFTYQEFFEVLLWIEDSKNAVHDDDDEEDNSNARWINRGQFSYGPRKIQNFK